VERDTFAITVVIPAYNEAGRIADAIKSAHAQTEPPAEVLVIDDGSTDETASIARSLGVRVLSQRNAGVSAARNLAIQKASCPWVAFCDADDILLPDKLAAVRQAHEAWPSVDFIFTDYRMLVDGRTTVDSTFARVPDIGENISEHIAYFERRALARALAGTNFILPSTIVVRRSLLVDREIAFATHLPNTKDFFIGEDIEWYFRLLVHTDALAIARVLTEHRRHPGSLSEDSGRLKYGDVILGERMARAPDLYVEGAAEAFARNRRRHVREAALYYFRALRFRESRAKLDEAQRIAFLPTDALLGALATLGAMPGGMPLARLGRRAWREALKPALGLLQRRAV
jgi:glycosyltransferase involved in cell wall biosynthesis